MNWRKIKAEYVAGGISQRALAEKYGIPWGTLRRRATKEAWNAKRKDAEQKAIQKTAQKTAEIVADNAAICERIKTKLLLRLDAMVDQFPQGNAQEIRIKGDGLETIFRMRDIAAVYAALEDKTQRGQIDIEDLSPLVELLK